MNTTQKYPISIPPITIDKGLDILLLELPPRYMPMMPNGIAYVHMLCNRAEVAVQTIDFNIMLYHRFHARQRHALQAPIFLSSGHALNHDPWSLTGVKEFGRDDVIEFFWADFEELLVAISSAQPRAVGFSINGDNTAVGRRIVAELRKRIPEIVILIGGYICVYDYIGTHVFPDFDYMLIGEAEISLPPLAKAIARGEKPKDLPGIISKWDSSARSNIQSDRPFDLDKIGWPKYEWADLSLYQSVDGLQLVPICASRGCKWSMCRFCGECFPFRKRRPESVADEIEYFYRMGFEIFHFNESDVNGDPENLYRICQQVIDRGIQAKFMGQLRIDKRNTSDYFRMLKAAGFVHLRFGVDGWSKHSLRLQNKGYNVRLIKQNLEDCHNAGIRTTVNIVVGVPEETEEDIDESIDTLVACSAWIDLVESFNPLVLMAGSEYYKNPDAYKIKFRGNRDDIYADNLNMIPGHLWYSVEPYIDEDIRAWRIERLVTTLSQQGVQVGDFASYVIAKFRNRKDAASNNIKAQYTGLREPPKKILLLRDLGSYNLVLCDENYLGLSKSLGKVDLMQERMGDRELLPYLLLGDSEEELRDRLCSLGESLENWNIVAGNTSRIIGYNKLRFESNPIGDYFVSWSLLPYTIIARTEAEVLTAIQEYETDR